MYNPAPAGRARAQRGLVDRTGSSETLSLGPSGREPSGRYGRVTMRPSSGETSGDAHDADPCGLLGSFLRRGRPDGALRGVGGRICLCWSCLTRKPVRHRAATERILSRMNISEFLERIIDGYLFPDLQNMAGCKLEDGQTGGGVGYPMLATCASGMELLGGLLDPRDYKDSVSRSREYFEHYWNKYLVRVRQEYSLYAKLFWTLVRNGVAHTYMAKAAIIVIKDAGSLHLYLSSPDAGQTKTFIIDCLAFYEDFRTSYEKLVRPQLCGDDDFSRQVEKNINLMLVKSEEKCQKEFAKLLPATTQPTIPVVSLTSTAASGTHLPQ